MFSHLRLLCSFHFHDKLSETYGKYDQKHDRVRLHRRQPTGIYFIWFLLFLKLFDTNNSSARNFRWRGRGVSDLSFFREKAKDIAMDETTCQIVPSWQSACLKPQKKKNIVPSCQAEGSIGANSSAKNYMSFSFLLSNYLCHSNQLVKERLPSRKIKVGNL